MRADVDETLARLQRDHDRDPDGAAVALRAIPAAAVPREQMSRYTFLLNHVLGEKLGAWDEVQAIYRATIGNLEGLALPALRNLAAAAALSGDRDAARKATACLGHAAGLDESQAALVVDMAKIMYGAHERADEFTRLCGIAMGWDEATEADSLVASMANNIVSAWLEMPALAWRSPAVARAMEEGARASRHFWFKAGTWVQKERADYLVAMTMNRLGKHDAARAHCLAAIAAIEDGGNQDVDLAFIALELAFAEDRLGNDTAAGAARARAQALASAFDDEALRQWFADTDAKLRALADGITA